MYSVGICDDGKNLCSQLEQMIMQWTEENNVEIEVNTWYTGESLKEYLQHKEYLDILFLDIELFKMTGIEVADYIRNHLDNMEMQIIYISGNASYARQLFRTQPLDFLVKPISQEQICDVMERAFINIEKKNERFEFQMGRDFYYVRSGEIIYFESEGRKVKIVTTSCQYEFYGKLKDISKRLNRDFMIIHQSYIINRKHVFRYMYDAIQLDNDTVLSISLPYRKRVREILLRDEAIC